ncbi:MAG: AMP-binding protein, partial [Candidatus Aminicenantes bacterium]|nr:AMP-binding protein [Candidatus Aminicenantes bacterium]NIM77368.1 AMP-binding protein [Candidatus Aminicenantes bacterium]NIN16669.1 AMP-binding protein [Candidatus Aminicenantes bacterium]NIN40525.1 AMP-binding protein [Candidatus Aminicenantes bacterium]NIN83345.1 AMP-binding protein [Candidatus Aminicenantes bacterium]
QIPNHKLQITKIIESFVRAFDLSKAPLLRVGLIKVEDMRQILMVDMHHIISDGVSIGIFLKEFMALYGEESLPEISIHYKDFSQWHNQLFATGKIKKQEEYWLREFAEEIPVLNLPLDFVRPRVQSFEGNSLHFEINRTDTVRLNQLAAKQEATLYMMLLALFNIMLSKVSGQDEIVVGTAVAGRRNAELQQTIGMFVNTLALKNFPRGYKTFGQFLEQVKQRTLAALENQDYPFEELVDQVNVTRDTSRNPLFDVMFVLENIDLPELELAGLKLRPYEFENRIAKFDLTMISIETADGLRVVLEYCTKLFKESTIERFFQYFNATLRAVLENPGIKIGTIEIISEEDKHRIMEEFNNTSTEFPMNKTIHKLFEEQAKKTSDSIAVVGAHELHEISITFRELNKKSNQLAHLLRERGVLADDIVGIMVERSVEMIIGILAILKAGGAYLAIEPEYPQERIDYMLKDSGAKILLSELSRVSGLSKEPTHLTHLTHLTHPTHLCYIIYTSGTTGWPKGTLMEHRSLVNLCYWHNRYYGITDRDHATQYAGIGFDASVWEIFPYLVKGAAVHIITESIKLDIDVLNDYYEQHNITVSFLPTQLCEQFMEKNNKSLRALLTGGDKLRRFVKKDYDLYNNYGPTENTVVTTAFAVDKPYHNIPIGTPIHNNCIFILNTYDLKLQPIGVWGELCITGASLARGYLNNPELTKEKFQIPNPKFQTNYKLQITNKSETGKNKFQNKPFNEKFLQGSRGRFFQKEPPGRRRLYKTG